MMDFLTSVYIVLTVGFFFLLMAFGSDWAKEPRDKALAMMCFFLAAAAWPIFLIVLIARIATKLVDEAL